MAREEITSVKNALVRRFREAAVGKPPEVLLAEGAKLVWEGLESGLPVEEAAVTEHVRTTPLGRDLVRRLEREAPTVHSVAPGVAQRLSQLRTTPGVAVIFRRPAVLPEDLLGGTEIPLLVVAAGVQDPGNLGALVRTAEAAGATGFLALAGSADPYREKAVRGAAGSTFRLPVLGGWSTAELLQLIETQSIELVVADGRAETSYAEVDFRKPTALVVGGEGAGIDPEITEAAHRRVAIPMAEAVESLNVAVAAGVVLFEARRQRG